MFAQELCVPSCTFRRKWVEVSVEESEAVLRGNEHKTRLGENKGKRRKHTEFYQKHLTEQSCQLSTGLALLPVVQ